MYVPWSCAGPRQSAFCFCVAPNKSTSAQQKLWQYEVKKVTTSAGHAHTEVSLNSASLTLNCESRSKLSALTSLSTHIKHKHNKLYGNKKHRGRECCRKLVLTCVSCLPCGGRQAHPRPASVCDAPPFPGSRHETWPATDPRTSLQSAVERLFESQKTHMQVAVSSGIPSYLCPCNP
jgi:hypothetical protein